MKTIDTLSVFLAHKDRKITCGEIRNGLIYALQLLEMARGGVAINDELPSGIDEEDFVVRLCDSVDHSGSAFGRNVNTSDGGAPHPSVLIDFLQPIEILLGSSIVNDILTTFEIVMEDEPIVTLLEEHVNAPLGMASADKKTSRPAIHDPANSEKGKKCGSAKIPQKSRCSEHCAESSPQAAIRRSFISGGFTRSQPVIIGTFIHISPESDHHHE